MRVSIIIPTYNTAHYLCTAIDSVLNSTFNDFEIIVVDDGSVDNTRAVIEKYIDQPFFIYLYQKNKGLAGARNTGIKAANGEYLVFLDSDDIILPDKLFLQSNFLDEHKDIDVVYSLSECFVENDINDRIAIKFPVYEDNIVFHLLNGNFIHVNSVMVRRNKVLEVECFNPDYRELEDWDLWLRMSLNGSKFKCIPLILSLVRVRRDSMTANQGKMNRSMYKVLKNLKHNIISANLWSSFKIAYYRSLLQFAVISNEGDFYSIFKESIGECGPDIVFDALKQLFKKIIRYNRLKENSTTSGLSKVWLNGEKEH